MSELWRMLMVAALTLAVSIGVAVANRDIYSRTEVDQRVTALEQKEDVRHKDLDEEIRWMREDIRWIVRQMGGTPSADTAANHRTP